MSAIKVDSLHINLDYKQADALCAFLHKATVVKPYKQSEEEKKLDLWLRDNLSEVIDVKVNLG